MQWIQNAILFCLALFVTFAFAPCGKPEEVEVRLFSTHSGGIRSSNESYTLARSAVGGQGGVKAASAGILFSPGYLAVTEMAPFMEITRSNTVVVVKWDTLDGKLQAIGNVGDTNWLDVPGGTNNPTVVPVSIDNRRTFRIVR